ncbi:hypothetical protein NUW58_g3588 [Xylaria curta]|uniref:Uncharacterized protein n=1 Tax=Xylaria curta TaxID=42375 RepID=A0ACC1PAA9_9PEZI|nr:hypothetical protein NUW58_g3588 [Xylaria curta]
MLDLLHNHVPSQAMSILESVVFPHLLAEATRMAKVLMDKTPRNSSVQFGPRPFPTEGGDPDVTGFGVLISFLASILITLGAIVIGYFTMLIPDDEHNLKRHSRYNEFDKKIIRTVCSLLRIRDSSEETRRRSSHAFQTFLLALSDQQLFTGFSLAVATTIIRQRVRDLDKELSMYSYVNAVYLAFFACIIHLASITTLRNYFHKRKLLCTIRVIGMLLTIGFLIRGIVESLVLYPDASISLRCGIDNLYQFGFFSDNDFNLGSSDQGAINLTELLTIILVLALILDAYVRRILELYSQSFQLCSEPWLAEAVRKVFMKRRSPQEESAVREGRALRRFRLVSKAAGIGIPADQAGLIEKFSTHLKLTIIESQVVWDDFTNSFFFEIIWLLFYFTLGIAQIGYSLQFQINTLVISTSPKFGQILPLTLVLLPFLNLLETYSDHKLDGGDSSQDSSTESSSAHTQPRDEGAEIPLQDLEIQASSSHAYPNIQSTGSPPQTQDRQSSSTDTQSHNQSATVPLRDSDIQGSSTHGEAHEQWNGNDLVETALNSVIFSVVIRTVRAENRGKEERKDTTKKAAGLSTMEARCQCGAVQFTTPLAKPLALYICHCAECRRQSSSAFGTSAIFPRFELPKTELLSCYTYFCQRCGTRLIHTTPGKSVVSVKGGCIEGLDWATAIHIWTKSAMVPIPESSESYSEEPSESDYGSVQETLDQPADQPGALVNSGGFPIAASIPEVARLDRIRGACELSGI